MAELNRKPILVAIDHGYGNVKTPNFIFPTGITAYSNEPAMATDTLCWAGRWYAIGDAHKEFIADKTADEDYLKLTIPNSGRSGKSMRSSTPALPRASSWDGSPSPAPAALKSTAHSGDGSGCRYPQRNPRNISPLPRWSRWAFSL